MTANLWVPLSGDLTVGFVRFKGVALSTITRHIDRTWRKDSSNGFVSVAYAANVKGEQEWVLLFQYTHEPNEDGREFQEKLIRQLKDEFGDKCLGWSISNYLHVPPPFTF